MKLSIITINRNNKVGLERTIKSVVSQSAREYVEYIVIDGASDDGSKNVLESNTDLLDLWVSEPDQGIYNAMNKGASKASGNYLLFLNSGDWLASDNVIEQAIHELTHLDKEHSNTFLIGKVNIVDDRGKILDTRACNNSFTSMLDAFNYTIPHPASFIPRGVMLDNPYDESYKIAADFKFMVGMLYVKGYSYHLSDIIVSNYNMSGISSIQHDLSIDERRRAFLEILPAPVAGDYEFILPHWKDRFRIKWLFTHKLLYKTFRLIVSVSMRLCK